MVKNLLDNAGDIRDVDLIPESGRSSGGGHDNLLQYSCLENPIDRGAWRATVHGVTQSRTRLKRLSMHDGSGGTESACSVADLGLIPRLERFPWKRA